MKRIIIFNMIFIYIAVQLVFTAAADYAEPQSQLYNITRHTPEIRSMEEETLPNTGSMSTGRKAIYTIVGLLLVAGGAAAAGSASQNTSSGGSGTGDINIEW